MKKYPLPVTFESATFDFLTSERINKNLTNNQFAVWRVDPPWLPRTKKAQVFLLIFIFMMLLFALFSQYRYIQKFAMHKICFIGFAISATLYMFLSTWLFHFSGRRRATNLGERSYETKWFSSLVMDVAIHLKKIRRHTYQTHIKCITENQKYGSKNYVEKEAKVIVDPKLKDLLERIQGFGNIPRKLNKEKEAKKLESADSKSKNNGEVEKKTETVITEPKKKARDFLHYTTYCYLLIRTF
uniref:Zf-LYAR domain-containing protein n=1 Tax=Heterorhabditis bacteriophora TaxID=37862 RepID=A0A1I7WFL8_HETBA